MSGHTAVPERSNEIPNLHATVEEDDNPENGPNEGRKKDLYIQNVGIK